MAYGSFVVQRDLTFTINYGDIFIIMGGSGCAKVRYAPHGRVEGAGQRAGVL